MIDWDQVLDLEAESYAKGIEEGRERAVTAGNNDGYKVGLKIGTEKYIPLGIIQSRARHWQAETPDLNGLQSLNPLIETGEVINTPERVAAFDRRYKLAKNKAKMLATKTKSSIDFHENILGLQKRNNDSSSIEDMY